MVTGMCGALWETVTICGIRPSTLFATVENVGPLCASTLKGQSITKYRYLSENISVESLICCFICIFYTLIVRCNKKKGLTSIQIDVELSTQSLIQNATHTECLWIILFEMLVHNECYSLRLHSCKSYLSYLQMHFLH